MCIYTDDDLKESKQKPLKLNDMLKDFFNAAMFVFLLFATIVPVMIFGATTDLEWLILAPIGAYALYLHLEKQSYENN